jgi:hypothetical protein
MYMNRLALSLLLGLVAGCAAVTPAPLVSLSDLPNCFDRNYDAERGLFTIRNPVGNPVNQQCLLTVGPRRGAASASRLAAGSYTVYLADGGGGGAGGTAQGVAGGGGGGAGAKDVLASVDLTEGAYRLTIGAGGPGGNACIITWPDSSGPGDLYGPGGSGGGPGWLGSPSSMVRAATGELVLGTPGAERYARPTRAQNERMAGKIDGHGGSGPGQAGGGDGGLAESRYKAKADSEPGDSKLAARRAGIGGAPGFVPMNDRDSGGGGGGGATNFGNGGGGGGEIAGHKIFAPARGSLGSGGGGGEGNAFGCGAGAWGGHGYIALRPN